VLEQVFLCIRTGASWNDTYWALAEMDLAGGAAALIRQQARDIDELWDRLSRAYLAVRREIPSDELRREIEDLRVKLAYTCRGS